jgi:tight adherence protein C
MKTIHGSVAMKMLRWLCCRGFLGLLALVVLVAPAYADDAQLTVSQVRATAFPAVTIRFTANSPRGALIPVLSPEDFVVEENGQKIGSVDAYPLYQSGTPLSVVIALDTSGSMNDIGKLDGAKQASKAFIAQLRPGDQVELISFNETVTTVVPFTTDRAALIRGIDGLVAKGNTVLYDATDRAVADALRAPGTHLAVVLTDGNDTASKAPLTGALNLAKQAQVPIYSIGLGADADDAVLARMASDTSGRYFKAPRPEDLASVFKLLGQVVANQYELTYFSPLTLEPGRKVDVAIRVNRSGVPALAGQFSYTMPPVISRNLVPISPGVLQPVVDPVQPTPSPPPPPPIVPLPSDLTLKQAALLTFAAVLGILTGLGIWLTRDAREARLTTFVTGVVRAPRLLTDQQSGGQLFGSILTGLAGLAARILPAQQIQQLRQKLALAGNPNGWAVEEFLGIRMLCAIVCAGFGYLYGLSQGPAVIPLAVGIMGFLGFLLPVIWLGGKIRTRKRLIFRAMPNALDLIAVTVEAGLGFDQAVSEVCQKWQNDLTREFATFLAEVQLGRDRREALRGIIERTGVPELNGFVSAIIQADELGTGIARTLTIQAEQVRIKRRQMAEKLAHEATIKMIFPLVFLIFPSIFVVILGPAIPTILEALGSTAK